MSPQVSADLNNASSSLIQILIQVHFTQFVTQYLPSVKGTNTKSKLSEKFKHKATLLELHFVSPKDSRSHVMAELKCQIEKKKNQKHH